MDEEELQPLADGAPVEESISEEELIALAEQMLEEQLAIEAKEEQERSDLLDSIGKDITTKLNSRMSRRKVKEQEWLESARLYLGSLATFEFFTSDYAWGEEQNRQEDQRPEVNIIRNKCDAAISQTIAYQFAAGDKNWDINPPAVVDMDDEDLAVTSQQAGSQLRPEEAAAFRANLMSKEIEYHLDCTRYAQEARLAMKDRVILGTGIMKGPLNSGKLKKTYIKTTTREGEVVRVPTLTLEKMPQVYRVNPWYFFPDDTVTDIAKAADAIEVHPMTKAELRELKKRPDFFPEQIARALEIPPKEATNSPFNDPAFLTSGSNLMKDKYLVAEYHGPITKEMIDTFNLCGCEDSEDEQWGEIWVVNGITVKVEPSNLEGCVGVPYAACVWESDPSGIYGYGIPMLARDQQRVVNETYKMMLDNAGISAGPQVVVDTTIITPAEGGLECTPFKVWYTSEYGADVTKAIQFFTPPNSYDGLANLFQLAKQLADEESSIPLLLSGIQTPTGAADSATGMAIQNQNATSPLFYKAEEWDDGITSVIIPMMYDWEMQFNPKDEIKFTYTIDVRTSTSYLRNSMDNQKIQALRQEIAQGSPIAEWVNLDELALVSLTGMRLPYAGLIKSPEQVAEERANAPEPPPDPNMIKAQNDQRRVELEAQKLELDKYVAQIKAQSEQQMIQMQWKIQEDTNNTRMKEAEAQVIKAQLDYQSTMASLAAKSEENRDKILADLRKNDQSLQVQQFLAGMNNQHESARLAQNERQLDIQEKQANANANRRTQ